MKVTTPEGRVSYPNVFKTKKNSLNGKEEYSLVLLFAKGTDLRKLQDAVVAVASEKWGADKKKWPKLRSPFRKHEDRMKDGEFPPGHEAGGIYLNLKNTQKPYVVDENLQPIIDTSEFYGGCYAMAAIRAFAYDQGGNRGISFSLEGVKKTRDGETFGTPKSKPEDDFAPIAGAGGSTADAGSDDDNIFG